MADMGNSIKNCTQCGEGFAPEVSYYKLCVSCHKKANSKICCTICEKKVHPKGCIVDLNMCKSCFRKQLCDSPDCDLTTSYCQDGTKMCNACYENYRESTKIKCQKCNGMLFPTYFNNGSNICSSCARLIPCTACNQEVMPHCFNEPKQMCNSCTSIPCTICDLLFVPNAWGTTSDRCRGCKNMVSKDCKFCDVQFFGYQKVYLCKTCADFRESIQYGTFSPDEFYQDIVIDVKYKETIQKHSNGYYSDPGFCGDPEVKIVINTYPVHKGIDGTDIDIDNTIIDLYSKKMMIYRTGDDDCDDYDNDDDDDYDRYCNCGEHYIILGATIRRKDAPIEKIDFQLIN